MNLSRLASACVLTIGVLALPAMALNTQGYNGQRQNQGQRQNGRFKGMDRNGDGVITRDEWRGNDTSFQKHDRNGDGVLSEADRQYGKNNRTRQNRQRD